VKLPRRDVHREGHSRHLASCHFFIRGRPRGDVFPSG
jgi:hypothetical protein